MNKLVFIAVLVVTVGYCLADEETHKAHEKFHEEMKGSVCKPETTDTAMMTRLIECKKKFFQVPDDKVADHEAKLAEAYKECGKDDEIKGYTKVDLTKDINKFMLMSYCSPGFKKCTHDLWVKNKGEVKKDPDCHKKSTPEQRAEFHTCLQTAVKV